MGFGQKCLSKFSRVDKNFVWGLRQIGGDCTKTVDIATVISTNIASSGKGVARNGVHAQRENIGLVLPLSWGYKGFTRSLSRWTTWPSLLQNAWASVS